MKQLQKERERLLKEIDQKQENLQQNHAKQIQDFFDQNQQEQQEQIKQYKEQQNQSKIKENQIDELCLNRQQQLEKAKKNLDLKKIYPQKDTTVQIIDKKKEYLDLEKYEDKEEKEEKIKVAKKQKNMKKNKNKTIIVKLILVILLILLPSFIGYHIGFQIDQNDKNDQSIQNDQNDLNIQNDQNDLNIQNDQNDKNEQSVLNISFKNKGYNEISDIGVEYISQAIKELKNLSQLSINLGSNLISDKFIGYHIGFQIDQNDKNDQSIQNDQNDLNIQNDQNDLNIQNDQNDKNEQSVLNISFKNKGESQISDKGAEYISQAIKELKNLSQLNINLRWNQISDKGAEYISQAIKELKNLSQLDLYLRYKEKNQKGHINVLLRQD
ncbi:hypothetical protein PPERSA_09038 [Pseudocohnilembus persalinus]|uniref:Transmembrane protein n=1 Tax=Pseudocohnilembus persalinus TaxID=266149 RepID=A0A0V0R342_PSEPJ|nr:hypothetical protein PPERSA_09038 [Pseudocohnilembus persalinus]|eukprot:KRX08934.1 hypothetical protein PPERSA_09038 [Pseudocohnilembus persalinus]